MKAFLSIPILLLTLLFTSCTKTTNEYVQPNQTILIDITPSSWTFSQSTNSYFITFDVPEIDAAVRDIDGILVAISGDRTLYEALPNVYSNVSLTYTYSQGKLTIESQPVGGGQPAFPNANLRVKIVIVQSSNVS
ncbi:hypothetical protein LX64_03464 [Chitinophaga skermanii]|uniref:SbsA Ig-like domain-containing protein n=1 Tax=Chitinophaga skermanii TaxID=331697 RepID=A0A327QD03_9BACT|nr:hypothetical protein [Chitinophaga skermanii]RAJ02449.1 hypothetical protein LX64_03464 [Chitinophaga skermanii]